MGRYWREASDLFFRRPVLWVPVVVADVLGSLLNAGQQSLGKMLAMAQLQYHSVLGGTVRQGGFTMEQARHVFVQLTALAWTSYFVRTLLYAAAFVLTAALLWAGDRRGRWSQAFRSLQERGTGVTGIALRALAVFAVVSITNNYLMRVLSEQRSPLVRNIWFHLLLSAIAVGLQVMVLTGPALRVLLGPVPVGEHAKRSARLMALLLGFASIGLAYFAGKSAMAIGSTTQERKLFLEILGSLLTAIPYILLFVGFGVIAAVERNEADEVALGD